MLTIPVQAVQDVVDKLVAAGVQGFWNFTPTEIKVPPEIIVRNERLAVGLMCLSFKTKRIGVAEEMK